MYSYEELTEDLEELRRAYPERLEYEVLAQTADGRKVYGVTVGNPNAEKSILIQAGIHAREYMTSQLVMKQLEFYLAYEKNAQYHDNAVSELLDKVCIHLVPMANPDGIAISQYGLDGIRDARIADKVQEWYRRDFDSGVTSYRLADYLKYWKANANGVDLNRNFSYGFTEYKGAADPGAQKYKGTEAGSEAETRALMRLTKEVRPVLTISYHATGSVLYWDYGQTGELRSSCEKLVELIQSVNRNEIRYASNDKQDAAGYGDWSVMELRIPSVTIEIGVGAAPLAANEFDNIWERNALLWAVLAEYAASR